MSNETNAVNPENKRSWIAGCGTCGADIFVKNAAIVYSKPPCDKCPKEGDDDGFDLEASVCGELGWCGCGNPDRIDDLMLTYLSDRPAFDHDQTILGDTADLLAYIADDLGWTEHGGSVGGAWLTDDGRSALANLKHLIASRAPFPAVLGVTP